jgi:hypothetical protein
LTSLEEAIGSVTIVLLRTLEHGRPHLRTDCKLIALFYGSQMLLSGIGMAAICYLSPGAFADVSDKSGLDLRLFLLTAGLIPQVGLGALLVWLGMPSRSRMRAWRLTRKTIKQIVQN